MLTDNTVLILHLLQTCEGHDRFFAAYAQGNIFTKITRHFLHENRIRASAQKKGIRLRTGAADLPPGRRLSPMGS